MKTKKESGAGLKGRAFASKNQGEIKKVPLIRIELELRMAFGTVVHGCFMLQMT